MAAIQMVSTPRLDANLDTASRLIGQAAAAGATLVGLPEYFCFVGASDRDKLAIAERPGAGAIQETLSQAARRHGVWVIGGTLPLDAGDPDRVRNASCVFSPDGEQVARYDKIHLFRYANEREDYDEARVLSAGNEARAFDLQTKSRGGDGAASGSFRVGLSVCYDLRFPELYRRLMTPPCDIIAVPSAFTATTGRAHWEVLLRARAIENQCYVLAPAQGGRHETGRRTHGHTMIVDPWGEVLGILEEGEGVVVAEVRRERLAEVRRQLPALAHRRL